MKARVHVTLRPSILDPQGRAIAHALGGLGFDEVVEVRQGKVLEIALTGTDVDAARARVEAMCARLLANPVVEDYAIEMVS